MSALTVALAPPAAKSVVGPQCLAESMLIGRLNQEWARLRVAETSSRHAARWAARHPSLAGLDTLPRIEETAAQAHGTDSDGLLLGLLTEARAGDELAARTVLQLMLGAAVRHAARLAAKADRTEAVAVAVGALWESIRCYPLERRPARVAANLSMDTLQHLTTGLSTMSPSATVALPDDAWSALPAPDRDTALDEQVYAVLASAVHAAVITTAEAHMLARVYTLDEHGRPRTGAQVARELGISWTTLRYRCSRTVRRLATAAAVDPAACAPAA